MPWAAIIPAAISAVGALGSAYLGSKNQGGGGIGAFSPSNPAQFALNDLFGTRLYKHGHGADAGTVSLINDPRNPGIFGDNLKQSIADFSFNPLLPSQAESDFIGQILNSAPQRLDSTLSSLAGLRSDARQNFGQARDLTLDLANTGFATDATPLFELANDEFRRNVLPAIAERQGALGGSIQSSGFQNLAGREAANLLSEAARANIGLAENAAQRRAAAIPQLGALAGSEGSLLASLFGTEAALPVGFAQDVLNLGTAHRNVFEAARARPIDVFSQLAGLGGPGTSGFLQGGFSPGGSTTSDIFSALSSNAGGIAQLLKGLGGLFGGGGGGAPGSSGPAYNPALTA